MSLCMHVIKQHRLQLVSSFAYKSRYAMVAFAMLIDSFIHAIYGVPVTPGGVQRRGEKYRCGAIEHAAGA